MGGAYATLFPITWREPFGLVMVESMASGTPVIAMRMGSAAEVIIDGKTGFLCNNVEECIKSLDKVNNLNRDACRQYVEENFSVQQMTNGYEAVYHKLIAEKLAQQNGFSRNALVS